MNATNYLAEGEFCTNNDYAPYVTEIYYQPDMTPTEWLTY